MNKAWYWGDRNVQKSLNGWMYENPVLHYLLREYEDSIQITGYATGIDAFENEQIEHISPQTPPNCGASSSGYDVTEDNVYTDEFREKYLNCLGNLMLISGSHNSSISNAPFKVKLASYRTNPLVRQQAELSSFLTDGIEEWKSPQIERRQRSIVAFALSRWSF